MNCSGEADLLTENCGVAPTGNGGGLDQTHAAIQGKITFSRGFHAVLVKAGCGRLRQKRRPYPGQLDLEQHLLVVRQRQHLCH